MLTTELLEKLATPFAPEAIKWRTRSVYADSKMALMVAYVDARIVAERLDEVVGGDWAFTVTPVRSEGKIIVVKGSLTIHGVTREDFGEHDTEADKNKDMEAFKAATSDALKRCAVLFGVGRHLYRIKAIRAGYDPVKRELTEQGRITLDNALYNREPAPAPKPEPTPRPPQSKPAAGATAPQAAKPDAADPHWIRDDKRRADFIAWAKRDHGLTETDLCFVLEASPLTRYVGTPGAARKAVAAHAAKLGQ